MGSWSKCLKAELWRMMENTCKLAAILGPTHDKVFKVREEMLDREREQAVEWLVEERKSKMCYMVAIPTSEVATPSSPPSDVDNKQVLKGRGRGRRIMSTSQGV